MIGFPYNILEFTKRGSRLVYIRDSVSVVFDKCRRWVSVSLTLTNQWQSYMMNVSKRWGGFFAPFFEIGKAMIRLSNKMVIYHGSKEIVSSPEIRIQRYNKDFYFGFYCTVYPEQAKLCRW